MKNQLAAKFNKRSSLRNEYCLRCNDDDDDDDLAAAAIDDYVIVQGYANKIHNNWPDIYFSRENYATSADNWTQNYTNT